MADEGRFSSWCEKTTWHGWSDLNRSNTYVGKLFWITIIAVSLAFFGSEIAIMMQKYAKDEKWSTTIYEQPRTHVRFPDVILCNFNQINITHAVEKWNLTQDLTAYLVGFYKNGIRFELTEKESERQLENFIEWRKSRQDYMNLIDLLGDLSHDCENTISNNYFFLNKHATNPCQFARQAFVPEFGNCIRIHLPDEQRNYTLSGQQFGLSLLLSIAIEHHLQKLENSYLGAGFALFVIDEYKFPVNWIALPVGFHSFVSLKRREETIVDTLRMYQLSDPPCARKNSKKLNVLDGYVKYESHACLFDCKATEALKICNCTPMLHVDEFPSCEPEQLDGCIAQNTDLIQNLTNQCAMGCSSPCERSLVKAKTSLNRFPGPVQIRAIQEHFGKSGKNRSEYYIRHNYVAVDIFFETTAVQVVYWYEKMPLDEIISNLGGTLGIAAGISILTVFQIIWVFIEKRIDAHKRSQIKTSKTQPVSDK